MSSTNWDNIGITWSAEPVMRQHGDHATDRRTIGNAQIPVLLDLAKFRENVQNADEILLGIWDGTSARVQAQDVCRKMLEKSASVETMREAVWNRILGVRIRVNVPKSYPLPDGKRYTGNDLTEYRKLYGAAQHALALQMGATVELADRIAEAATINLTF